jgi:hypothetical protein
MPLLATPLTDTTTFPFVAPLGTLTVMLVGFQLVAIPAERPLNVTVLAPWGAPKFVPVIVTEVPAGPVLGLILVMLGEMTVKAMALLVTAPTVTVTFPVVAPAGTGATMLVPLQLVGVAVTPPIFTKLLPCVGPKFEPEIVTNVPADPEVGFRPVIVTGDTVKFMLLLANPLTVTTTGPVVAPLGTGIVMPVSIQFPVFCRTAGVPLKVTLSPNTQLPKFMPEIVTDVPTGPEGGKHKLPAQIFVMVGAIVNGTPPLASPPTKRPTFPLVAPVGTGTVMLVSLQSVGLACVRLNVTVLVP